MTFRSRIARLAAAAALALALTACETDPVRYFITVAFEEQGASPAQVEQAVRVAHCESTHRHNVISPGGGNWGLFQINTVHRRRVEQMGYRWDQMLFPLENARVAAAIWAEQGWRPWTCARNLGIR